MLRPASGAPLHVPRVTLIASMVLLTTTATVLPAGAFATTAAGRTKGEFAVSPNTGAATYTIPIWAPPGPRGVQPHIALTYNSQVGNNYVGVGWGISGLSSIFRCNLTYAQDAAPGPVALATSDGYCMDGSNGQRLRLLSGTYGEAGSTYQTESDNFMTVTAYGSAGNGPAYWIAVDRNGWSYTYGNGGNSQVLASGSSTALSWQLNEVSDSYGNTMTIAYNTTSGSTPCVTTANLPVGAAIPCTISWTPATQGGSTYNYTMSFFYNTNGTNAAQSSIYKYAAGTAVQNTDLLSSIAIASSGTAVKTYYLTYSVAPTTGRDRLAQVQECAGSGTSNCLAPTVFTYQNSTAGVTTTPTDLSGATYVQYDFNGDGYPDILYASGGTYYVAFGSASGYQNGVSTGISTSVAQILPGDLLGTGPDGLLVATGGNWYYYSWNGSTFTSTSVGTYDGTKKQYLLADVNGDGLPDLISTSIGTNSDGSFNYTIYTQVNTGNGSTVSFGSAVQSYYYAEGLTTAPVLASNTDNATGLITAFGSLRSLDFNGDGRADLAMQAWKGSVGCWNGGTCNVTDQTYELISGGTTSAPTFTGYTIYSVQESQAVPVAFLNFNSDACTDYLVGGTLYVAGCDGSTPSTLSVPSGTVIGAMDWDGDGRTDILVSTGGTTISVYKSEGNQFSSIVSTSVPYSSSNSYFTFQPNGFGQDALGYSTASGGAFYYARLGNGTPPDLLTSVTDAFGNSASPTYVATTRSSNYTPNPFSGQPYPDAGYNWPVYVTTQAVFSDPSTASGTYNQTYAYWHAGMNVRGRGFVGFDQFQILDSRPNSLTVDQYFYQDFPYTWMSYEQTSSSSSLTVRQGLGTRTDNTISGTPNQEIYFPYFSNWTSSQSELGGTENGDLITTTSTNYSYDTHGNPTSISTTTTDNDPNSPYKNDTWTTAVSNTWDYTSNPNCANLLSQGQVAYSVFPTGPTAVTVTKTYSPDKVTTHCDYLSIVTQSNSGASYAVTETFGYDAFGNVNSDTITGGGGMTPRLTSIGWGTTGQFPVTIQDPMFKVTNAQTQISYNYSYGLPASVTDQNGLITQWQYDTFARESQETRPDGTYTTFTYTNCAGSTGCLVGSNGLNVNYSVYAKNATLVTSGATYNDPIDRPLVSLQTILGGSSSRVDTRYDSLGRVSTHSFPCTYTSFTAACTYLTTNSYDALNRLIESQRPISSTNSNPQSTNYAYAGRTTTVTDALQMAWITVTDVNGWLRQTRDPYGYAVTVAYDTAGNKTTVTDSSSKSLWSATYNYGIKAFPATITDIDMGTWTFTYDALGEKTAWKDAKSQSFSETYDALSRPLTRTEPDYYTAWTWGISASSDNIGKLQSVCTGTGSGPTNCTTTPGYSESEAYDTLGRLSTRTRTLPGEYGGSFTYTWGYDSNTGLLSTLTYPTSYPSTFALKLNYGYSSGILEAVTAVTDSGNVSVWTANTVNPRGQITEETLGNNIVTNRAYDAVTGWLGTAQSGVNGGSGVKNLSFLYDYMGDVTQRQDNNLGLTENIYYDNDHRFSYSQLNGTQNLSVSIAPNGNILSRTDVAGGASWTYSPTQIHAVTQAGSSAYQYAYDANGNATSRQGSSIAWASYNYPTSISAGSGSTAETVALSYGPDRQRWQQYYTGNSTTETTDYVGKGMEVVASGGVTDYRHYIYGGGGVVAVYSRKSNGTNTFSYLLSDHQASTASITNSSGAQVAGESFTAFGNRRNPTTWSGPDSNQDLTAIAGYTREGYTFQTALGLWMGMNHMNGRVQDAVTGRMLSADPNIPDPRNTQSYNRYSYVYNNPLTYTDPTGFDCHSDRRPCDGDGSGGDSGDPGGGDGGSDGGGGGGGDAGPPTEPYQDPDPGCPPYTICLTAPKPTPVGPGVDTGGSPGTQGGSGGGGVPTRIPCRTGMDCYAKPKNPGRPDRPTEPSQPQGDQPQLPDLPPPQCEKGGGGCNFPPPPPPTTCPNGGTPSVANDPNVQSNITNGAMAGGSAGILAGWATLFIFFPEVVAPAEGIYALHALGTAGAVGGMYGAPAGGILGYASGSPTCP